MTPLHVGMRVSQYLISTGRTRVGTVIEVNTSMYPDRPIARVCWDEETQGLRKEAYTNYWQDCLTPVNYDPHAPD